MPLAIVGVWGVKGFRRLRAAANEGAFRALRSATSATRRWTRAAFEKAGETLKKGRARVRETPGCTALGV